MIFVPILGEPLEQRADDRPEIVAERLGQYEKLTAPLVQYYLEMDILKTFAGTESNVIWPRVREFISQELLC